MKGGPYYKLIEELKCNFMDTEAQLPMYFPIPGLPDYPQAGVINGFLKIDSAEIRGIFEPIIEEILRLIQEQIDTLNKEHGSVSVRFYCYFPQSPISAPLPRSQYSILCGYSLTYTALDCLPPWRAWVFFICLQKDSGEAQGVNLCFRSPTTSKCVGASTMSFEVALLIHWPGYHSWNAVARGAVIYGLQKRSKQACANYGVKVTFDLGAHLMKNETWHNNPVKWFVKKVFLFNYVSQEGRSSQTFVG